MKERRGNETENETEGRRRRAVKVEIVLYHITQEERRVRI